MSKKKGYITNSLDPFTDKRKIIQRPNSLDEVQCSEYNENCYNNNRVRTSASTILSRHSDLEVQPCRSQTMSPSINHRATEFQRNRSSLSESTSVGFEECSPLQEPRIAKMKRSLYGVCPSPKFGPKASLQQSPELCLPIQYPTDPMLRWESRPENVMVIKKMHDDTINDPFVQLVNWLVKERTFKVFIENKIKNETSIMEDERMHEVQEKLVFFGEENRLDRFVDLVICAGGDGTLIYASSLFQEAVPPIIAFNFGSLGFLLPFNFNNFKQHIDTALRGQDVSLVLRSRMIALLSSRSFENCVNWSLDEMQNKDHYLVLNEVVVDRGDSAYIGQLDLFVDDTLVTVVQGDGLIICTPTGSTAYSAAAGASMVHPNVPAIIVTPICPHSLSFRPIVLPAGVQIKIMIAQDARAGAWVSFDGRKRQHLTVDQMLVINTAVHPLPCVTCIDPITDWFTRLAGCLHWNVRKLQSSLQTSSSGGKKVLKDKTVAKKEGGSSKSKGGEKRVGDSRGSKRKDDDQTNNSNDKSEDASSNKKLNEHNLRRFNRTCTRRNKIYNKTFFHKNPHKAMQRYLHAKNRQTPLVRSSSLIDIQLNSLEVQQKNMSLRDEGSELSDEAS